ncbi:metallophosphoesterase family protein [Sanguibacter sp. A247]|uniref:metallophosphoesterase family protein n=1 Tax=unclassified Sanguibacter TaxID=2645534 RepID=UPI003FD7B1A0
MQSAQVHPRPGRALPPVWLRRSLVALAVILISLVVGVVTARADLTLGPHEARYEVTTDGIVTVDLGPLGTIELESPAPVGLGVRVTIKEIPTDLQAVGARTTLEALDDDVAAYLQFFTGPQATVRHATEALVEDAARRALAVGALSLAALVGLGALLGRPRRTELLARFAPHTVTLAAAVVLALVAATVSNGAASRSRLEALPASTVFAGTSLEGARITGRLSGIIEEYGGQLVTMYDKNEAYYAGVVTQLDEAWLARAAADEQTASFALLTTMAEVRAAGEAAGGAAGDLTTPGAGMSAMPTGEGRAPGTQSTGPDGAAPATPPGAAAPSATDGAPGPGASTAEPDDSEADAADADIVTFLHVSDLHCNIGMAPVIHRAAQLAGASAILDTGDTSINGTAVERVCVEAFTDAAPEGTDYVLTTGNHDSEQTAAQARAAGAIVLEGAVADVAGVKILGDRDARETRLGSGTVLAGEEAPDAQAERLASRACEDEPDLLMIHTPRVGTAALATGCVPLQISGHLHRRTGPVPSGLGALYVSGTTAGAAEGQLTIGPLGGVAQMTLWRFDRTRRTWLDARIIAIAPDGSVEVGAAVRVPRPTTPVEPIIPVEPDGTAGTTGTTGTIEPTAPTPSVTTEETS